MIVKNVKGDIFDSNLDYPILHGVNCQGVMGAGFAREIRKRFPNAYSAYKNSFKYGYKKNKLGTYQIIHEKRVIINAFTQEFYGRDGNRYVSYDAIAKIMQDLDGLFHVISMPQIGSSLGGGDWNVTSAIINSEMKNTDVLVFVP